MAAGPKDTRAVELSPIGGGRVLTLLTRQEIDGAKDALWLTAQEETPAKVWDTDEDAACD